MTLSINVTETSVAGLTVRKSPRTNRPLHRRRERGNLRRPLQEFPLLPIQQRYRHWKVPFMARRRFAPDARAPHLCR
jgi:hypothetical protein